MWHDYELDSVVRKTNEPLLLSKTEKGMVEIGKDALALGIRLGDSLKGYVFHGRGKLVLDTIVETEDGAFGKPVERELGKPFLMIGNAEPVQGRLVDVSEEDLKRLGYERKETFLNGAKELASRFLRKRFMGGWGYRNVHDSVVFAFPNDIGKFDLLVTGDSRLVYRGAGLLFVADGKRVVLKSPEGMALSAHKGLFTMRT